MESWAESTSLVMERIVDVNSPFQSKKLGFTFQATHLGHQSIKAFINEYGCTSMKLHVERMALEPHVLSHVLKQNFTLGSFK